MVSNIQDWLSNYQPEGSTLERVLWIIWALWVLFFLVAVFRVIKFRFGLNSEEKMWQRGLGAQKPAVIIVPIKGVSPNQTSKFFQSLLEQDYENYRIIVTVETGDDPAAIWVSNQFRLTPSQPQWFSDTNSGLQSVKLVVAGKAKSEGQKVHNQLAAFNSLTEQDEVIVFVDADIQCPPDWLGKLTYPINNQTHDIATTYRWLVPEKPTLANRIASVINASITTQGGNTRDNMPWGGSTAIGRSTFQKLDVPSLFAGCLNDDLRLGKAAKRAGYKVGYLRSLVRPTDVNYTWSSFFEFARRQYLQAKFFSPILYLASNVIFSLYFWGFVSVVVAVSLGYFWAWVPLVLVTLLDQLRASVRESIYRKLFGHSPNTYKRIAKCGVVEHLMTPIYMSLHGLIVLSTWFMDKMEWGGIRYQVKGVGKTKVLERKPTTATPNFASIGQLALPAGVAAVAGANGLSVDAAKIEKSKPKKNEKQKELQPTATIKEKSEISRVEGQIEDKSEKLFTFQPFETSITNESQTAEEVSASKPKFDVSRKSTTSFNGIGAGALISGVGAAGGAIATAAAFGAKKPKQTESASKSRQQQSDSPNFHVPLKPPPNGHSEVKMIGLGAVLPSKKHFVTQLEKLPYYKIRKYTEPNKPERPLFVFKKLL